MGTGWTVGENVLLYYYEADMPIFTAIAMDTRDQTIGYWKIQKDRCKNVIISFRNIFDEETILKKNI